MLAISSKRSIENYDQIFVSNLADNGGFSLIDLEDV